MLEPFGTLPRHIKPWERWADVAATSEVTVSSTSLHVSLTGISSSRFLFIDWQSGLSTHTISASVSGPVIAVGVGSAVAVGVGAGVGVEVAVGRTVGVGLGSRVAVGVGVAWTVGNGVAVGVGSAVAVGAGVTVAVGVGWTVGRGAAVATAVFPAGDGLGTGAVTIVGVGCTVGKGVEADAARGVGVGLAGIGGVTVLVEEGVVVEGPGVSSTGAGELAPADRMVGSGVDSIPWEHATMATVVNSVSRAPGRDLI